mgnify:CR=1 FL=1
MNKKILVLFFIVFIAFIGIMKTNAKVVDNVNILTYSGGFNSQGFGEGGQECIDIVGENLSKIIKLSINVLRIAGAIIAIIKGMTLLIPPIMNGDAKALQTAGRKCVKLGIVLLIIGVFPTVIRFIGHIFNYDLSCIFDI